jgi:transcriptional regulator with XRE-family HTH domain
MDYANIGKRIRERRNALRLSQVKLAETAYVTTSYIGQIERAERIPSLETLVNISKALNVTVDYLLQDIIKMEEDMYSKQINELLLEKSETAKATAVDVIHAILMHVK